MMATLVGSCQRISMRACQLAARSLHSQTSRHMVSSPTQRVTQLKKTVLFINDKIFNGNSNKCVTLYIPVLSRTLHSHSCKSIGRTTIIPVLRQGNQTLYVRFMSGEKGPSYKSKTDILLYTLSVLMLFSGLAYAGVPLFKMFCKQFGFGGNPDLSKGHDKSKVGTMEKVEDREIVVSFHADRHASMRWNFQPQQKSVKVKPGETALAFYSAENPTDKAIIGISTYTVTPYVAAPYFNKIQCFCFEEQILNPHEKVDMPVFFYIDPEYDEDPQLEFEDNITLSYTFFEAKEGLNLPLPGFLQAKKETA